MWAKGVEEYSGFVESWPGWAGVDRLIAADTSWGVGKRGSAPGPDEPATTLGKVVPPKIAACCEPT